MWALRKHCQTPWVLLYVERWLKAPMQTSDGNIRARDKGTPQGGVVSPLLANLFLHYAFDQWVDRHLRSVRFCRYADDAIIHRKSRAQAQFVLQRIDEHFRECGVEQHQCKTRIVYCKDINRRQDHTLDRVHLPWLYVQTAQSAGQIWPGLCELLPGGQSRGLQGYAADDSGLAGN